jgi:hypothetical protein
VFIPSLATLDLSLNFLTGASTPRFNFYHPIPVIPVDLNAGGTPQNEYAVRTGSDGFCCPGACTSSNSICSTCIASEVNVESWFWPVCLYETTVRLDLSFYHSFFYLFIYLFICLFIL